MALLGQSYSFLVSSYVNSIVLRLCVISIRDMCCLTLAILCFTLTLPSAYEKNKEEYLTPRKSLSLTFFFLRLNHLIACLSPKGAGEHIVPPTKSAKVSHHIGSLYILTHLSSFHRLVKPVHCSQQRRRHEQLYVIHCTLLLSYRGAC